MPSPTAFRKGFNLDEVNLDGFKLKQAPKIGHEVKKTFKLYHFPIEFKFEGEGDQKQLLLDLSSQLCKEKKIIPSDYGNPYSCYFEKKSFKILPNEEDSIVRIHCLGIGERVKRDKEKKTKSTEEAEEDAFDQTPDGYRVLKSRFNTGTCSICEGKIDVGRKIIQKKGQKGGWSHVYCFLHREDDEETNPHKKMREA